MEKDKSNIFFWRGKRVTEKVYKNRVRMVEEGKRLNEIRPKFTYNQSKTIRTEPYNTRATSANKIMNIPNQCTEVSGRRIFNLNHLDKSLLCQECHQVLSLLHITQEKHCIFASTFIIQCNVCLFENIISTDTSHEVDGKKHFDVNSRIVIGALDGGMEETHINKLMSCMDIPIINHSTFEYHEKEVSQAAEALAKESYKKTSREEIELILKNAEELLKFF